MSAPGPDRPQETTTASRFEAASSMIVEGVSHAVDRAVTTLWVIAWRRAPDARWASNAVRFATVDEFFAALAARPAHLAHLCRLALGEPALSCEERDALNWLVRIADVLDLRPAPH
jgi:hypothetical protein